MATALTKPIKRETTLTNRKGRKIIVVLDADNTITFKSKGTRQSITIYLGFCMNLARIMDAEYRYKKAMERYKELKSQGKRARKPKRPSMPFSNQHFEALK